MLLKTQQWNNKKRQACFHLKVNLLFPALSKCKFSENNVTWRTVISQLSAVRWHFSQLDGFLRLTSVSKGSVNHSQRLPLDRDANRALTDPVPPSLWLGLIHHPPNKTSGCLDQTRQSQACGSRECEPRQRIRTSTHTCTSMHMDPSTRMYAPSSSITVWQNKLCITYTLAYISYHPS